ncbi:ATP-binding domain-containing protein [Xanthomonas sp. 1678]|uniref:ATP-binding domain-containing protein n=1 Tax=Xanthomonas sp. 1678 TaxID=3158788 RepID=UPI0034D97493
MLGEWERGSTRCGRPDLPGASQGSVHKAKGLECDHAMACDKAQFSATNYAKCRMYVALSRAKESLTLVVSDANPTPLFKL